MAAPHTYNYVEFHQHTGKGHDAYTKYLRYVANYRANKLAAQNANPLNANPLMPVAPGVEIPQLHKMAQSEIAPLLTNENTSYAKSVKAAQGALSGYSSALAQFYQPQSDAIRNNTLIGTGAMAAANGALGSQLAGGAAGQSDLAAYLQKAGGDTAPLSNFGTTGANLLAAKGTAAEQGALGSGLAAANSAAFLPTFAAQTGKQTLANQLAILGNAHSKSINDINAQSPDIFNKLYNSYVDNEIQKAIARESGYTGQVNAATSATKAAATVANQNANYYTDANGRRVPKGYVYNTKGQLVKQASPTSTASGPGSARYKAYHSALGSATTKANSILQKAIARTAVSKQQPVIVGGVQVGTQKVSSKQRIANYYGTIHSIEAAVTPLLSPYMGPNDITRWVQQMVNKVYGAGKYGRPGSGVRPTSEHSKR